MSYNAELLFTLDVSLDNAASEAKRLTDWLVARGWVTASLAPGPRAFATGAVTENQGGSIDVIAGPRFNMQGPDMDAPLCPYCSAQVDFFALVDGVTDDNQYPVVRCESCGRDVAYVDWRGTAHPIMSNLTLELDSWMLNSDGPDASPLLTEIREEMGGRWVQMWFHR